ncbi:hypothetical protein HNQ59_003591 [Chitinivorax tropicus]|uniref:Uncharacterized protein n=1 Tax=Chitinivorax tropicus TaxID=714531 RepID=A0A840MVB4_9PROT|nr:hypothetical protein [Chitinivorax tropicus]
MLCALRGLPDWLEPDKKVTQEVTFFVFVAAGQWSALAATHQAKPRQA